MSFDVTLGPRVRKSPFFESTVAAGVRQFTIYNHMYLPIGYGDPEAEYRRLMTGVAMWDVAAQRQVEIHGPDAAEEHGDDQENDAVVPVQDGHVNLPGESQQYKQA